MSFDDKKVIYLKETQNSRQRYDDKVSDVNWMRKLGSHPGTVRHMLRNEHDGMF